jgi:SNF2 family DNA or RNA helicase
MIEAPRVFAPRPYQSRIAEFVLNTPRCAVWAGMGMGKTSALLTVIEALQLVERDPVLVLAPLRVANSTWPNERAKWTHTWDMSMVPVTGSLKEKEAAVQRFAQVHTCNYENLPWLVEFWGDRWPYRTIVADESTKLKSFRLRQGGKRAHALAQVAHSSKVSRFIQLTGTPAPNGLIDLWGQIWFLDKGKRLGSTFTSFKDRWFAPNPNGFGVLPLPHAQAEIQALLSDLCITVEAKDWFDLRAPIVNNIHVDLPAKARGLYKNMEKEMFMQLSSGHEVEAFNAASRTIKCLQLASGAVYTGEGNSAWQTIHDQKILALEEVVEEAAGAPVLVAYHFKSDLDRLLKAFPQARALDKNPATEDKWREGKIPMLLAHPAGAGHGLNLQDGGNILAYFSHWWNLEERMQILERIGPTRQVQSGYDRPVHVHNIIARDTVDEDVIERNDGKRSVQEILLDAMKRRI